MTSRYKTGHLTEGQFDPGSRGRVLKNSLGIRRRRAMDALEAPKLALLCYVVQARLARNYTPMQEIFRRVVRASS